MLNRIFHALQIGNSGHSIVVGPSLPIRVEPARSARIVIGPSAVVTVRPSAPIRVQVPPRGAWLEKGWSLERGPGHETYHGFFTVTQQHTHQRQRFPGRIEVERREIIPYIADPPAAIRSHPKGPCFSLIGQGWFRIHWHRPPNNVDDAILYVERILDEVVNRRLL